MKKSIYILFSFFALNLNAQVYYAGTALSLYFDINPDTLIAVSMATSGSESYFMDINGDLQNDYKITSQSSTGPIYHNGYVFITSLNPDLYIRYGSTCCAKPLQFGDSINSGSATWINTNLYLVYTIGYPLPSSFNGFIDTVDKYIGIKYQSATDSAYGWIRVRCSGYSSCKVKDYSMGQSTFGIRNFKQNTNVTIYPNPASAKLQVQFNGDEEFGEIVLYDVLGNEIKKEEFKIKNAALQID